MSRSPTLSIPLRSAPPDVAGIAGFRVDASIWVCENLRRADYLAAYHRIRFRVDTGSVHTQIATAAAREVGIEVPERGVRRIIRSATGLQSTLVREGAILVKFFGLEQFPLLIPCVFHDALPPGVPALLGLSALRPRGGPAVLWNFDARPSTGFPNGHLDVKIAA